jgi:UDPglucose--hexose-1-phosphate uridylyltransferase
VSELRFCAVKNRWTIIAPERKMRPQEFVLPRRPPPEPANDPFARGNERLTPPEILVLHGHGTPASGPGWQVRVFPNRFPVLRVEGEVGREGVGLFDRVHGVGAHEVIVENPDPSREMADLPIEDVVLVLLAYRARLQDLRRDTRLRYILIFKNKGQEAGASVGHPHSQLIATPIIPPIVKQELASAREHYHRKERCLFCDIIREESHLGERVAIETDRFLAIEPFASAYPFETWILPRTHLHDFVLANDDDLYGLARILRDYLRRIRVLLDDPPYNLVLHTAPSSHLRPAHPDYWQTIEHDFHWHIEIIPRITRSAGFEWGSGLTINPTAPEEAAQFLREADPEFENNR